MTGPAPHQAHRRRRFTAPPPLGRSTSRRNTVRVGLASFEYSINDPTLQKVLYAEIIFDASRRADGTRYRNVFVVGSRCSFDF